jgi:D-arabinose 1-dehydrogenase-like Zn-dependent alcohol dehydrogenase
MSVPAIEAAVLAISFFLTMLGSVLAGAGVDVDLVANLTRRDGEEFMALAPRVPVRTEVTTYSLEQANVALEDLRAGRFRGAAVLEVGGK